MDKNSINYVDAKLVGSIFGFASHVGMYLDIDKLYSLFNNPSYGDEMALFIIYHEIAHYKRIIKYGIDNHISMVTSEDENVFVKYVLSEELFADRWASYVFYCCNRKLFPTNKTQKLNQEFYKDLFTKKTINNHKLFSGKTRDDYEEMIKKFIIP